MKKNTSGYGGSRRYLTLNEVQRLLDASRNTLHPERNRCLIFLAFVHGLRASELCALRLSDIDLMSDTLCIHRLKNGFSTIHPFAKGEKRLIQCWLDVRDGHAESGTEWLFPSRNGQHLSRQMFHLIVRTLGVAAGLSVHAHPHMLRHACGYALADRGVDTRLIQDYLGHRNIHHTVLYTASNPERFSMVWGEKKTKTKGLLFGLKSTLHSIRDGFRVNISTEIQLP